MSATPSLATYEYVVHQLPPNLSAEAKDEGSALSKYLTQYMNKMASEGWEFYRMDSMDETVPRGCLSFGGPITRTFIIATFRRKK
jgi:hypothetical protein